MTPLPRSMRPLAFLALLSSDPFLVACGGGGGGTAIDEPAPEPVPAPEPEPEPAPAFDAALEAQLVSLARAANAGPMLRAPAEDPDLVELGRALFFDRVLSGNRDVSCATCHRLDAATGDGMPLSIGTGGVGNAPDRELGAGVFIARNAPPLFRLAGKPSMFRDGRVVRRPNGVLDTPEAALNGPVPALPAVAAQLTTALAAQAMFPVISHEEMSGAPGENEVADAGDAAEAWSRLARRLVGTDDGSEAGIEGYRDLFSRAFPGVPRWDEFHFGHAARAIAAFESTAFDTAGSRYDAWFAGNPTALSDAEKRGGVLFFGAAGCVRCHGGPVLADGLHHAIGAPQVGPGRDAPFEDTGRFAVTGNPADRYRFATPSLRNVAVTGPWMHDGAYTTLEAAVRHYVDPVASLRNYDATQLPADLRPLVDVDPARQDARAAAVSPIVRPGLSLTDAQIADLVAFLGTLTDATALDLSEFAPFSVPSGLPIDD